MHDKFLELKREMQRHARNGVEEALVAQYVVELLNEAKEDEMIDKHIIECLTFSMQEVKQLADMVISKVRAIQNTA